MNKVFYRCQYQFSWSPFLLKSINRRRARGCFLGVDLGDLVVGCGRSGGLGGAIVSCMVRSSSGLSVGSGGGKGSEVTGCGAFGAVGVGWFAV